MYTGHIGVALAARRAATRVPLLLLVVAAQGPDWITVAVGALGVHDPGELWSHSVPAIAIGALVVCACYLWRTRDGRGTWLLCGVYLSHPLLDLVTGRKPPWPGGAPTGACLYHTPFRDFVVEAAVLIVGWYIYRKGLPAPKTRRATFAPWLMLGALLACQALADVTQAYRLSLYPGRRACAEYAGIGDDAR